MKNNMIEELQVKKDKYEKLFFEKLNDFGRIIDEEYKFQKDIEKI